MHLLPTTTSGFSDDRGQVFPCAVCTLACFVSEYVAPPHFDGYFVQPRGRQGARIVQSWNDRPSGDLLGLMIATSGCLLWERAIHVGWRSKSSLRCHSTPTLCWCGVDVTSSTLSATHGMILQTYTLGLGTEYLLALLRIYPLTSGVSRLNTATLRARSDFGVRFASFATPETARVVVVATLCTRACLIDLILASCIVAAYDFPQPFASRHNAAPPLLCLLHCQWMQQDYGGARTRQEALRVTGVGRRGSRLLWWSTDLP